MSKSTVKDPDVRHATMGSADAVERRNSFMKGETCDAVSTGAL